MSKDGWALPENTEIVVSVPSQPAAAIGPGVFVGMANVRKMFAEVEFVNGIDVDCEITVLQAPLVDGVGATAMTSELPMWASLDTVATSVVPEVDRAASYIFDAGDGKNQLLVIQIEPIDMDDPVGPAAKNNAVSISVGASDVANIVGVKFYVIPRVFHRSLLVDD